MYFLPDKSSISKDYTGGKVEYIIYPVKKMCSTAEKSRQENLPGFFVPPEEYRYVSIRLSSELHIVVS
mgnify:CR=1 FL=1